MEEKKQTVLMLKFIGIDDFSCPTYEDQYGRFWKDLNLGKSETPDLYSTTRNDLDGEPVSPIRQEHIFDPEPFRRNPYEFQYFSAMGTGVLPSYPGMIRSIILTV